MRESIYYKQAELLLRILPIINTEVDFALKGGTAINFFVRDMPRLSVDIDLTYLQMNERETALEGISKSLLAIYGKIRKMFPDSQISSKKIHPSDSLSGLICPERRCHYQNRTQPYLEGFHFYSAGQKSLKESARYV
ncbi:MAG: nucleotidyl transferase AbiEii/AbiGii toxin family protein [Smithellaceae bacterium]